jgi:hypothetical protein
MADFAMKRAGNSIETLGELVCTCADEKPFNVVDVMISADTDEKGLMASRNISKGTVLFSVDAKHFISEDTINASVSSEIEKAIAGIPNVDSFLLKMIVALHECKHASNSTNAEVMPPNSIRATYFETLPLSFGHMPMNYPEEALNSFGPSFPLAYLANRLKLQAQQAFDILSNLDVLKSSPFSFPTKEFVNWAVCCLNSRCFELKGDKTQRCLVPFADLLNHSFNPTLVHQVDENGTLIFLAAREIVKDEELTISYQSVNDSCSFLLHYGINPWCFTDDVNASSSPRETQAYFRVSYEPEEVVEGTVLRSAIQSLGLSPSCDMALPATLSQPLPALWIWLLRLKGMSDAQRQSFVRGQVEVSVQVEAAAWQTIRETLTAHKKWYDECPQDNMEGNAKDETAAAAVVSPSSAGMFEVGGLARSIRANARQVIEAALLQLPPQ